MPLVSSRELLLEARRAHIAVGAFNAENMEFIHGILAAAEETDTPVIIQTTPGSVAYAGFATFAEMVKAALGLYRATAALHLDHGDELGGVVRAVQAGYTSVMIDGSHLDFAANIEISRRAAEIAHAAGLNCEAELGSIGGKEDTTEAAGGGLTNPGDAAEFIEKTGIDSLAVAIGTAHGIYKGVPKLDVERLSAIRARTGLPLVLHGASGLSADTVRECVRRGICKVNYATELRIAFTDAVRAYLAANPGQFDPKKYLGPGRDAVRAAAAEKIRMLAARA